MKETVTCLESPNPHHRNMDCRNPVPANELVISNGTAPIYPSEESVDIGEKVGTPDKPSFKFLLDSCELNPDGSGGKLRMRTTSDPVEAIWLALGCKDPLTQAIIQRAFEVIKLFDQKEQDYGPSNIAIHGELGLAVRLQDKVARLSNLLINKREPNNESIRDTFIDIADYGLIGLVCHDGDWPGVEK